MNASNNNNTPDVELPLVPENILKRRHDLDALKRKKDELASSNQPNNNKRKKSAKYVWKPETILARARSRRNHQLRYQRVKRKGLQSKQKQASTNTTKDVVFCIRIRGNQGAPASIKGTLKTLNLHNIHTGVFLDFNKNSKYRKMLERVQPFVLYGTLSKSGILELLQRRGYATIDKERTALSDNTIIEAQLGQSHNLLCVEDLVEEIYTKGEHFNVVCEFLDTFTFADSKSHFERHILRAKDGKVYGDQGPAMQDYLNSVL